MKHINVVYHFIRERVASNEAVLTYVQLKENCQGMTSYLLPNLPEAPRQTPKLEQGPGALIELRSLESPLTSLGPCVTSVTCHMSVTLQVT